jgi:transketolase
VIDLYSIKPLDTGTLLAAAEATGRVLTVEDHWREGGLGDAVRAAFEDADEPPHVVSLAVTDMPGSGKPEELLAAAGIDAAHIAVAARQLVAEHAARVSG